MFKYHECRLVEWSLTNLIYITITLIKQSLGRPYLNLGGIMEKTVSKLAQKVKDYITKNQLLSSRDRVLIAVSGGPDSIGLLLLLDEIKEPLDIELFVAHFDHQLRPESASEGDFTETLAKSFGIKTFRGAKDIGSLAAGKNLQSVARKERYSFLKESAMQCGANKIATAHHANDQAETMLLHLLRGSGLEGLSAIAPVEGNLIRPLLNITKEEIEEYLSNRKQGFCLDQSNLGDKYLRNKLRHHLLPSLKEYNPRIIHSLGSMAEILRGENELLNLATAGALEDIRLASEGIKVDKLKALPLALKRRVLRLAYEEYAMPRGLFTGSLSFERTEAVLALKDGQRLVLPKGLWFYRRGNELLFSENLPEDSRCQYNSTIPVQLSDWQPLFDGWQYRAEIKNSMPQDVIEKEHMIVLPPEYLSHLYFRTKKDGDIISPDNMDGHKKVKKIFQEYNVPQNQRAGWPLLLMDQEIIWIPGLRKGKVKEPEQCPVLILICCSVTE